MKTVSTRAFYRSKTKAYLLLRIDKLNFDISDCSQVTNRMARSIKMASIRHFIK